MMSQSNDQCVRHGDDLKIEYTYISIRVTSLALGQPCEWMAYRMFSYPGLGLNFFVMGTKPQKHLLQM